jgi:hypothetical protein
MNRNAALRCAAQRRAAPRRHATVIMQETYRRPCRDPCRPCRVQTCLLCDERNGAVKEETSAAKALLTTAMTGALVQKHNHVGEKCTLNRLMGIILGGCTQMHKDIFL